MPKRAKSLADRFWSRVKKTEGCWLWTGHTVQGYGCVNSDGGRAGTNLRANRVAWILTFGAIPDGLHVLHKCDNKICVNPSHLELGTHAKNLRDAAERGLFTLDAQRRPGTQNGRAKITERDVKEIRAAYAVNAGSKYVKRGTCLALADKFGIDPEVVRRIAQRKLWKHIE
jgi:hypothetical protein